MIILRKRVRLHSTVPALFARVNYLEVIVFQSSLLVYIHMFYTEQRKSHCAVLPNVIRDVRD